MPSFIIRNDQVKAHAIKLISELSYENLCEVTILPWKKRRTKDQNALLWSSLISDFVTQGILNGSQFSGEIWHYQLKKLFLPEVYTHGETLKGYEKWKLMPDGEMVLVGSTTRLTTLGMTNYLEQCYAFGAGELGIGFTTNKYD